VRLVLLLGIVLMSAGCDRSVDYYVNHTSARNAKIAECSNAQGPGLLGPGRDLLSPQPAVSDECMNAYTAARWVMRGR